MLGIARRLAGLDVSLLRAEVWKPRTYPSSFAGAREQGFGWWRYIVASRVPVEGKEGLSDGFALQVFQAVHEEVIRH
ncbi:MAG: hypothetical protein IH608_13525 [Proteobacteria bacterium]|nr:hypothetical protein [Pseudomonadota bacterium]